jgi:hypothetical protein
MRDEGMREREQGAGKQAGDEGMRCHCVYAW